MTTQHTPGPWVATHHNIGDCIIRKRDEDMPICKMWPSLELNIFDGTQTNSEVFDANARLIAAAPELLKQLERIVTAYNTRIIVNEDIENIKNLIAKAKGEI